MEHSEKLTKLHAQLNQGTWESKNDPYLRLLQETHFHQEAEEQSRKHLLTKLALVGKIREQAAHDFSIFYRGKVGKPDGSGQSYLHIGRNMHYTFLRNSLKRAIRLTYRFNAQGRILTLRYTPLDFTHHPPESYPEIIGLEAPTSPEEQNWTEKEIHLSPITAHQTSYQEAFAFQLHNSHTLEVAVASAALERGQRLMRNLADALWNNTPFSPSPHQDDPQQHLSALGEDMVACYRIGNCARLWPLKIMTGPRTLKIKYVPFTPKIITDSGWARSFTIQ